MTCRYYESFTASNGSAWPTGWTMSEGTITGGTRDIQSNAGRLLTVATNFNIERGILGTSQWSRADGEVVFKTTLGTTFGQFFIILRGSGDWNDPTDDTMPLTGYRMLVDHNSGQLLMFADVAGVTTQVGSTVTGLTFNASTTYINKLRIQNQAISFRVWDASTAQPAAWNYTGSDSTVAAAGQLQFGMRNVSSNIVDVRVDDVVLDDLIAPPMTMLNQSMRRASFY